MLDTLAAPRPDTLTDPILAWRTWTLCGSRDGGDLRLLPLFGDRRPWPARTPARASCTRRGRHAVPGLGCTCGWYAMHDHGPLRRSRDPAVLGTVALWGRVVEHDFGFRAEYAYPQRMRLVCFLCLWQWGADRARACEVVVRRSGSRLVPLCAKDAELCRRYGYPMRQVLDGREVEQALLGTYAVDLLRTV
jgi:hypothetical protein